MEQVFFNVPLSKLKPIFKSWIKEAQNESRSETTAQAKSDWFNLDELIAYDPQKRKKPTFYALVSQGKIPYHKKGKKLYFLKSEIDNWLKAGRKKTNAEIEAEANLYLVNNKKGSKDE